MHAVIKTGGKQYRVQPGDELVIEKIVADKGQQIVFEEVLAVGEGESLRIGTPKIEGRRSRPRWWCRPRPARSSSSRRTAVSATRSSVAIVSSIRASRSRRSRPEVRPADPDSMSRRRASEEERDGT